VVKTLIKNLVGKVSNKGKNKKTEDVPDELPSLAEDSKKPDQKEVGSTEEKKIEPVTNTVSKDTPLKIDSTNIDNSTGAVTSGSENQEKKEVQVAKSEVPEAIPTFNPEPPQDIPSFEPENIAKNENTLTQEVNSNATNLDKPNNTENKVEDISLQSSNLTSDSTSIKQDTINTLNDLKSNSQMDSGFFNNLIDITKNQGINEKLLDKNLYKRMVDYNSVAIDKNIKSKTKKNIEHEVIEKLNELNVLERSWKRQKEFVEKNQKILDEDEENVQIKVEELKPLLKQLNFYEEAPVGKYFRSEDGVIAKNVYELLNLLKVMDEKVFKNHITERNNDFYLWIRDIIKNKELATKISKVTSKKEMVLIIEQSIL
jgi:hypothetical protein